MLKYLWKHKDRSPQTHKDDNYGNERVDTIPNKSIEEDRTKRLSLRSTSSFCDEEFLVGAEDSAECLSINSHCCDDMNNDIFKYNSRLSMSIAAIVADPNCLCYFIQYLETKDALAPIKFYLDTQNFKTAALTSANNKHMKCENHLPIMDKNLPVKQKKSQRVNDVERTSIDTYENEERNLNNVGSDEKNNSVPELKTLCDLSMRKPLTDDEKSQIYAETNKQMTKFCNNTNKPDENCKTNVCHKSKNSSSLSLLSNLQTLDCKFETVIENDVGCNNVRAVSISDAISIYKKYLIPNAKYYVRLPIAMLSKISFDLCKRNDTCEEDETGNAVLPVMSANCFEEAQDYILQQLEHDYLNEYLQTTYYCKYCLDLIDGTSSSAERGAILTISDILFSEVTLFYFMEYLEQHEERECLDFWTTAINYRKSLTRNPTTESQLQIAQVDAMIIYERFFSLQTDHRLWLSDKMRSYVEERICNKAQVAFSFDLPLQVVAKYLEQKYLKDFLNSQLFGNFVNELKAKLNGEFNICSSSTNDVEDDFSTVAVESSHKKKQINKFAAHQMNKLQYHRKTNSDCTNDRFKNISGCNTLLAMDTTHMKHPSNLAGMNFNINSDKLTDPNLLWQRTTSMNGGLNFGRINALGRYERDFDTLSETLHNPSANNSGWSISMSGNKIKNAVMKLVNLSKENVQEEIAWQVAELIVKDVTSVTLSSSTDCNSVVIGGKKGVGEENIKK